MLDANARVGLVGTWMDAIGERGQPLGRLRATLEDYVDFLYHTLIMRVYVSHPSAMYRREPVLALGSYDETTGPSEDKDLWRKLALCRYEARIVPEALVLYRLHDRQLSQTQAPYQRQVDAESQERFLAQLAPDASVGAVRRLLACDRQIWDDDAQDALAGLELVLAGARMRLQLDAGEARRLDERVADRLLELADMRPWSPAARLIAGHALARLPRHRRAVARRRRAASYVTAPVLSGFRHAVRTASDATESLPGVPALRARARQSPLARRLYGKAIGSE